MRDEKPLGPLELLQTVDILGTGVPSDRERELADQARLAAYAIAYCVEPTQEETYSHQALSRGLAEFLFLIMRSCPPGPERSTAIARAREARAWAATAVAMKRRNRPPVVGRT